MALQRMLLAGLVLTIILAPLPFGSMETWSRACLTATCFGLAMLWVAWRSRNGFAPLPLKDPVLLAGALFSLVGVLQVIPLPRAVLELVSPHTVEIRDRYESPAQPRALVGDGTTTPFEGLRPLSLDSWATRRANVTFIGYLLIILITIDLTGQKKARRAVMLAFITSGTFQAVYGLAEFIGARQHIFLYVKRYYTDVATGTFINRNHYAGYLAMTLPMALALSSEFAVRVGRNGLGRRQGRPDTIADRNLYVACGLLAVALIMATALASSRSRMGILCAMLSIVGAAVVMTWRSRQLLYAIAGILVAVVTILILYQGQVGPSIFDRFVSLSSLSNPELGRLEIWSQTLAMARKFPVIGIGLGAYSNVFRLFRTTGQGTFVDHAESDYLQLISEIGLLGIAIGLIAALCVLMPILKRRVLRPDFGFLGYGAAAGVIAIVVHSMVDSNLTITSNAFTFSVLVGSIVAWSRVPPPVLAHTNHGGRSPRSFYLISAMLAMGVLASVSPCIPFSNNPNPRERILQQDDLSNTNMGMGIKLGMMLDGNNPRRLLASAGMLSREAHEDMRALLIARPNGPFSEITVNYVVQRLRSAESFLKLSIVNLPTEPKGHLAMAELVLSQCAALMLNGGVVTDCFNAAESELWAALELDPMSATTHARVARVVLAVWDQIEPERRAKLRVVIDTALRLNQGDDSLKEAARSRGFEYIDVR